MIGDTTADYQDGDKLLVELEACEAEMADKVDACLRLASSYRANGRDLAARARLIADRAKALENHAARLDEYVKGQLEATGIDHYASPNYPIIKIRNNPPAVTISEDAVIPEHYLQRVETIKPLKAEIKAALKAGEVIHGCSLVHGTRLVY